MGACEGVKDWDCNGGQRFSGPGTRKWSCFVNDYEAAMKEYEVKVEALKNVGVLGGNRTEGVGVGDGLTSKVAEKTAGMVSSEVIGGFTAGVTGS